MNLVARIYLSITSTKEEIQAEEDRINYLYKIKEINKEKRDTLLWELSLYKNIKVS